LGTVRRAARGKAGNMRANGIEAGGTSIFGPPGGYAAAAGGLRTFDGFAAVARSRLDAIERAATGPAAAPAAPHGAPGAWAALAGALAAYASSEPGRAALGRLADAASGALERFAGGAVQLRLPLA
jgi:hypothetical protein